MPSKTHTNFSTIVHTPEITKTQQHRIFFFCFSFHRWTVKRDDGVLLNEKRTSVGGQGRVKAIDNRVTTTFYHWTSDCCCCLIAVVGFYLLFVCFSFSLFLNSGEKSMVKRYDFELVKRNEEREGWRLTKFISRSCCYCLFNEFYLIFLFYWFLLILCF